MRRRFAIFVLLVTAGNCDARFPRSVGRLECRQDGDSRCLKRSELRIETITLSACHERVFARRIPSVRGGHSSGTDLIEGAPTEPILLDTRERLPATRKRKARHTSDVVRNILEKREIMGDEEIALKERIDRRAKEYLTELESSEKPPMPLKFLHYLAPKVPAIKLSPDLMLRIQTARGDFDSGIAATIISTMAQLCVQYEKKTGESISKEVCRDRRFEQLVECVLCGVDVLRRTQESKTLAEGDTAIQIDMEALLDEEDVKIHEGLSVPDACRAAWGIAMLTGYRQASIGGQKVTDILTALSLRTRERLLARLQLLRQGELRSYTSSEMSLAEGFDKDTQDLAEDVASAMWTFACVKATTGLRMVPLFEASCSLLCQNPMQLRRREQAKKVGLGVNDFDAEAVVEKLAKSENATVDKDWQDESTAIEGDDEKDVLLHWLSPNEVAGIMWAVALHGRTNDAGSKDEMMLSETATVLSELAFDCIGHWLKEDLAMRRDAHALQERFDDHPMERIPSLSQELVHHGEGVVVEVVDAATILAKESAQAMVEIFEENMTINEGSLDEGGVLAGSKEVQVVDAATLLTMGATDVQSNSKSNVSVSSRENAGEPESKSLCLPSHLHSRSLSEPHFTNHKLCSIVWAATDLQDSLRNSLLDIASDILSEQGSKGMLHLSGGDLANLAWAIARRTQSSDFVPSHDVTTRFLSLARWIAERSLLLLKANQGAAVFDEFQAPELGRLMWSLSMILSNLSQYADGYRIPDTCFQDLAVLALTVSNHFASRFGTEDLARVTWAVLELSVIEEIFSDPATSAALGRLVSIMEASVLRWENGQCEKSNKETTIQVDESIRFASFLGKPRLALRLLEQRLDTAIDEDDESQVSESGKGRHLPLLRDLSMDPSTMCKLAYGLSRAQVLLPEMDGAWTFTRVAVRLMSSKHGQLLRVSSPGDNVRLAYACVTNQCNDHGRDFISRLFARRFVQRLNELLNGNEKGSVSRQLALSSAETATLVWSMGNLGVRHWITEQGANGTAYKKLRLVTSLSLLSESELESSSSHSIARLLHGAVSMEMLDSAPGYVMPLLLALEAKSLNELAAVDLCDLTECLARIMTATGGTRITTASPGENPIPQTEDMELSIEDKNATGISDGEDTSTRSKASDINSDILASAIQLLHNIADIATERVQSMTAVQIRKLLANYAGLPFQADGLIDAIDMEVIRRLHSTVYVTNLPEAATQAANAARGSWDALVDKSEEGGSRLASFRKGLRSLFVQTPGDTAIKEINVDSSRLDAVADLLTETATTASLVRDHFARVSRLTNKDPGLLLSAVQRGSVFELSRCEELIASYRRVHFESGNRQSRQDDGWRKAIGHQVISRIFY